MSINSKQNKTIKGIVFRSAIDLLKEQQKHQQIAAAKNQKTKRKLKK